MGGKLEDLMCPVPSVQKQVSTEQIKMVDTFHSMQEYVEYYHGRYPVNRLLIANNGISAVKIIRSLRKWCYETFKNEKTIEFVVMATTEDIQGNAEYIRLADQIIEVPSGSNHKNYANVMLIIELAQEYAVDAIFVGWGHASENPLLPEMLSKINNKKTGNPILFIGPSSSAMKNLGDKIGSTIIAQSANVPTIQWSGSHVRIDYQQLNGTIPSECYEAARVHSLADAIRICEEIGYPLMIKASEGGGGKGIRKVKCRTEVENAYNAVQNEVKGSPIFIMKLLEHARHLEVQLLGDEYGNVIALKGRDCSVQRRHQKIIEEGPVVAASAEIRTQMESAAIRLARKVGYTNAGTVEYLYVKHYNEQQNNWEESFYFLELNPRLQVEHPVTEMLTNVNILAAQLQIAMGIPLYCIPDIRRFYNYDASCTSMIDFETVQPVNVIGHVIATRITAENPDAGFIPTTGEIEEISFKSTANVWGYFTVENCGKVHEYADSQIGHLFSYGKTREIARKNVVVALKELLIRGKICTIIECLIYILESYEYIENQITTDWLDSKIISYMEAKKLPTSPSQLLRPSGSVNEVSVHPHLKVQIAMACLAYNEFQKRIQEFCDSLTRGRIPTYALLKQTVDLSLIYERMKYSVKVSCTEQNSLLLECNRSSVEVVIRGLPDGGYLLKLNNKSYIAYTSGDAEVRLLLDGMSYTFQKECDPSIIKSAVTGRLVRYLIPEGTQIEEGIAFAEVESMKMYMPILSTGKGVIHFKKSEGSVILAGEVLAVLVEDDDKVTSRISAFEEMFYNSRSIGSGIEEECKPMHVLRSSLQYLKAQMRGYYVPPSIVSKAFDRLLEVLRNVQLPLEEINEAVSSLLGRIPMELYKAIEEAVKKYEMEIRSQGPFESNYKWPVFRNSSSINNNDGSISTLESIILLLDSTNDSLEDPCSQREFQSLTIPLRTVLTSYANGWFTRFVNVIGELLCCYSEDEIAFYKNCEKPYEEVIGDLRKLHPNAPRRIYEICRSHHVLRSKNQLVLRMLKAIHSVCTLFHLHAVSEINFCLEDSCISSADSSVSIALATFERLASQFSDILQPLSELMSPEHYVVSLEARHLLIDRCAPSFETRQRELLTQLNKINTAQNEEARSIAMEEILCRAKPISDLLIPVLVGSTSSALRAIATELYIKQIYRSYSIEGVSISRLEINAETVCGVFNFISAAEESVKLKPVSRMHCSPSEPNLCDSEKTPLSRPPSLGKNQGIEPSAESRRHGLFYVVNDLDDFQCSLPTILHLLPTENSGFNVLHVVLRYPSLTEDILSSKISQLLEASAGVLGRHGVFRITFMVETYGLQYSTQGAVDKLWPSEEANNFLRDRAHLRHPGIYTFRQELNYKEDYIIRHVEPSLAYKLELKRLKNHNVKIVESRNRNVHIYVTCNNERFQEGRFFVRVLVQEIYSQDSPADTEDFSRLPELQFVEALNCLELAIAKNGRRACNNHIFVNVLPMANVHPIKIERRFRNLAQRYSELLLRLQVAYVELKVICEVEGKIFPIRIMGSNPTGYVLKVETYLETAEDEKCVLASIGDGGHGELDGQEVNMPHALSHPSAKKRELAMLASDTLYIYDYLQLFEHSIRKLWKTHKDILREKNISLTTPRKVFDALEVVRSSNGTLEFLRRPQGQNDIGMVAWLVTFYTPQSNSARKAIIIGNDITYKAGSFGTKESAFFEQVSKYARDLHIPRIYLAANAGARIGIAEAVQKKFQIKWKDNNDVTKGYAYLYLSEEDYLPLKNAVNVEYVKDQGDYRIIDIIGEEDDIGVENLQGSGSIAGETCKAYHETFTLTFVCGRSVGIGAYLVRLGQRTIQKQTSSPIILTGYQALNKLMGKKVYSSNEQLGGTKVMYNNGISHLVVNTHMEGIDAILNWLTYVPVESDSVYRLCGINDIDQISREIGYQMDKMKTDDPRYLITGRQDELNQEWISGFMDKGSFTETLGGWAKSVIVGRARLGGIALGVIVPETRTTEKTFPADPAVPSSHESLVQHAGQVWYPDSAYKTAQAINDFKREKLPLLIFANWRGFSGGQRDMYEEVLKYGALIVDALVNYELPVFVYIPPQCELRGGAWAVLANTINADVIEMYADPLSRGGILEPTGLVEIKFRKEEILKTSHRLDCQLKAMDKEMISNGITDERKKQLQMLISEREEEIGRSYEQVAVEFADLHDRSGRMIAKNAIRKVVEWKDARKFFYWRLRRCMGVFRRRQELRDVSEGSLSVSECEGLLSKWFAESVSSGRFTAESSETALWEHDHAVVTWLMEEHDMINEKIQLTKRNRLIENAIKLGEEDPKAIEECIQRLLVTLNDDDKKSIIQMIRRHSIL